jgi:UDP-N-acetylmuramyl-tripeptide synthetase
MNYKTILQTLEKHGFLIHADLPSKSDEFLDLSYSSLQVQEGTLFICKGENFKSIYLHEAVKKGASAYVSETRDPQILSTPCILVSDIRKAMAILSELFYDLKEKELTKLAVTGSKGKTTTLSFLYNILDYETNGRCAYTSTNGFYDLQRFGKQVNTTMESLDNYLTIRRAKEMGATHMVMEISSQASKQNRIYDMKFDIGIFTNLGLDHISENEHKDFEEYLFYKIQILKQCEKIVINRQTDCFERIYREVATDGRIIRTFGITQDCDYYIYDIQNDECRYYFHIRDPMGHSEAYSIDMFGQYNVLNAAAAISCAKQLGCSEIAIRHGLAVAKVEGRSVLITDYICPIVIDYAHNHMSTKALFDAIEVAYPGRSLKVVFGCPGGRGVNRRAELGDLMGIYASQLYLTLDDPGDEDFYTITSQIIEALSQPVPYRIVYDREEAIRLAMLEASVGDVVAIIGKGHEKKQLISGVYYPYKGDINVVSEILNLILFTDQ